MCLLWRERVRSRKGRQEVRPTEGREDVRPTEGMQEVRSREGRQEVKFREKIKEVKFRENLGEDQAGSQQVQGGSEDTDEEEEHIPVFNPEERRVSGQLESCPFTKLFALSP